MQSCLPASPPPPPHSDSCYLCSHSMDKEKCYPQSLGTFSCLATTLRGSLGSRVAGRAVGRGPPPTATGQTGEAKRPAQGHPVPYPGRPSNSCLVLYPLAEEHGALLTEGTHWLVHSARGSHSVC